MILASCTWRLAPGPEIRHREGLQNSNRHTCQRVHAHGARSPCAPTHPHSPLNTRRAPRRRQLSSGGAGLAPACEAVLTPQRRGLRPPRGPAAPGSQARDMGEEGEGHRTGRRLVTGGPRSGRGQSQGHLPPNNPFAISARSRPGCSRPRPPSHLPGLACTQLPPLKKARRGLWAQWSHASH